MRSHFARLTHGRDVSYALMVFLMLEIGLVLGSVTWPAHASSSTCEEQNTTTNCSSSYIIYAVVPAPVPTRPAIITSPTTGQSFSSNPVNVSGTCPAKTIVQVFTNGILVGSTICTSSGTFTVPIDLVVGTNALTALAYNANNQPGPTSPTVTVTLTAPNNGLGFSSQLLLQTENYYQGTVTGRQITWPFVIVGGQAPYAVDIDWGDGSNEVLTRLAPGPFTVSHTYKVPGTGYLNSFPLIVRATDAAGHTAYLQVTTIVNLATAKASGSGSGNVAVNKLLVIWPIWIVIFLMIISFWLGERREKRIMQRQLAALA